MLRLPAAFHVALHREMNLRFGFGRQALARLLEAAGDLASLAPASDEQPVNDVDGAWLPRLIRTCVDRHMSHKTATIIMGLDKGQATRQMNGDGHLSAKRVGLLPAEVLLDVASGIIARFSELALTRLIKALLTVSAPHEDREIGARQ